MNLDLEELTPHRIAAWALLGLGALAALYLIFHAIPLLLWVAITVGPAVWVYLDAEKRNNDRALLWGLLCLASNVLGLIIYLIARPEIGASLCPSCSAALQSHWVACPHCGRALHSLTQ